MESLATEVAAAAADEASDALKLNEAEISALRGRIGPAPYQGTVNVVPRSGGLSKSQEKR